jgi:hypothetical protein
VFAILMCVHVIRNHNEMYWLFIILALQPLGGIIYFLTMVLPSLAGGSTSRRLQKAAKETLDPTRAYRTAKQAYDDAPTPAVTAKLAEAAAGLGHHGEAEKLYAEAAQGMYADDPTFLLGRADSLVELGRNAEALDILNALGDLGEKGRTPRAALLMGRAYEALDRFVEADDAYAWAADRYTGLEASARYAAFLQHTGRTAEAQDILADLNKRYAKTQAHFRKDAKTWRDFAAAAVEGPRSGP